MLKLKDGFKGERLLVLPKVIVNLMKDNPLMSMLHITDIGYYPKAHHHFMERNEPTQQYVLIHCVDGKGWYKVGGTTYSVKANQYFILPKGKPHAYGADEQNPWTIYWIHFDGTVAHSYAPQSQSPTDVSPNINSRIDNRTELFEEIYNTLSAGYSMDNLEYASSLFHHYLGSLRHLQQYRNAKPQNIRTDVVESALNDNNTERGIVDYALHYMSENIEKHLTIQQLSDYIGYSSSHVATVFKRQVGHAPLTYFNLLKIQRACHLLDTTSMRINQISLKLGIEDTYYFSRLFSKIMGVSPREYRKTKKG